MPYRKSRPLVLEQRLGPLGGEVGPDLRGRGLWKAGEALEPAGHGNETWKSGMGTGVAMGKLVRPSRTYFPYRKSRPAVRSPERGKGCCQAGDSLLSIEGQSVGEK